MNALDLIINILEWILNTFWPLVGTIFLGWAAWNMWVHYIQNDFMSGIDYALLEIIPPREVERSPRAMELFFTNALYHWSMKGGMEEYWQGAVWFWFSLEIVSIEGQVHFYIRTPTRVRELIETQMYAQYPQCQIKEVPDYTLAVNEISETGPWKAWGCEFELKKPEAFPIATYVDYELNENPDEEFKVDPISPVIEFFSTMKKGEQAWVQIVITPSKKEFHTAGTWRGKHDWVKEAQEVMNKLLKPYTRVQVGTDGGKSLEIRPPKFYDNVLKAMNSKTGKLGFDTGIRVMYVAKRESWNMNNRRNIRLIFRQYAKPDCNELSRTSSTQGDAYGGIFTIGPKKVTTITARMLHEYRERSFFHSQMRHQLFNVHTLPWPISPMIFPAYKHQPVFVLNVEELATLWHFPGQILKVPTLERIESKEAAPPPGLPT